MLVIFILLQFVSCSTSSLVYNKFNQKCTSNTRQLFAEDLKFTFRSVHMCSSLCAADHKCLSLAFNKMTGTCLIYGSLVDSSCTNTITDPGYKYYEKVEPCYGNIDCNPCQNGGIWDGYNCTCVPIWFGQFCERLPTDCTELYDVYPSERGGFKVYEIQPLLSPDPFKVKCYMEWGGYTYLMDRMHNDTEINFNRNWLDYKLGFGDLQYFSTEFWLGLEKLYAITSTRTPKRTFILDITIRLQQLHLLPAFDYFQSYYSDFWIESEINGYQIHIAGYSTNNNNAGDSMFLSSQPSESAVGQRFSTFDEDNDQSGSNCAEMLEDGWWFNDCTAGCPTCPRVWTPSGYRENSVASMFWKYDLNDYALNFFDLKIKAIST